MLLINSYTTVPLAFSPLPGSLRTKEEGHRPFRRLKHLKCYFTWWRHENNNQEKSSNEYQARDNSRLKVFGQSG